MLSALQQLRLAERPCGCGEATIDGRGNVVSVRSCPVCSKDALDFLKRVCYDASALEGVSHERQLDMFSDTPSGSQSLLASPPKVVPGLGRL